MASEPSKMPKSPADDASLPRVSRKRLKTTDKLLSAFQSLILEKGYEGVNISDITERADVALGTFYNYFDSKAAMLSAVSDLIARSYHLDVDYVTRHLEDPAEKVAASALYTMRLVLDGSGVGKFFFECGIPIEVYAASIRLRGVSDFKDGIKAGRFKINDPNVIVSMLFGGGMSVASEVYFGVLPKSAILQTVEHSLVMLGIERKEARLLARKRYPKPPVTELPVSLLEIDRRTQEAAS